MKENEKDIPGRDTGLAVARNEANMLKGVDDRPV